MNKLFLSAIVVSVVLLAVFVFAQVPFGTPIIVNANNCFEGDVGLNYLVASNITGSFWWPVGNSSNGTFVGTFTDVCISNITLLEGVCGSSIAPAYSNLAGAVYVDCANWATNSTSYQGRCSANKCI